MADADDADTETIPQDKAAATLGALLAAGTATLATRSLIRQIAKGSLGPVGLVITAGQALIAARAAVRAVHRWRAGRRPATLLTTEAEGNDGR
jgi:hypothetical protein